MTPSDLTSRVSRDACVLGAAVAGPAAWLGGLDGALGAAAGAVIAVGNFRWLASRVTGGLDAGSTVRALWTLAAVLRLAALAAAVGLVLVSRHPHPLPGGCGLSLLPVRGVAHRLRGGPQEA